MSAAKVRTGPSAFWFSCRLCHRMTREWGRYPAACSSIYHRSVAIRAVTWCAVFIRAKTRVIPLCKERSNRRCHKRLISVLSDFRVRKALGFIITLSIRLLKSVRGPFLCCVCCVCCVWRRHTRLGASSVCMVRQCGCAATQCLAVHPHNKSEVSV